MRRLLSIPGITIAGFLVWKTAMLLFTAQPVPSNDAFFYDGPVVNYVLHGKYCNPSLAQVLPISGTEVFSAYPPLYQAVLLFWVKGFGTDELCIMWFHLLLLSLFSLVVFRVFRELNLSASVINFAGLFLFGITFHDRPDTLAHLLGALTVLAVVRECIWPAAALLLLTFCTSLQIGGIYSLWVGSLVYGAVWLGRQRFPVVPVVAFIISLLGLIALVKFRHPLLWDGFREHVKITPSFTGLRLPQLDDCLKVIRTAPGIIIAALGTVLMIWKTKSLRAAMIASPALLVSTCGMLAAAALMVGCLFILTPNTIHIAGYLQPVILGCFLAALSNNAATIRPNWLTQLALLGAVLLVSIRAIGMTTWGVLCARDVSRAQAMITVNRALDAVPVGNTVFVSAAYLYQAAQRTNLTWIHSDWPAPDTGNDWELRAIERLKPATIILTQFDYYRRYEAVIAQFRQQRRDVEVTIHNQARVQPPDAIPATRKIIQHISWAPVTIEIKWPILSAELETTTK